MLEHSLAKHQGLCWGRSTSIMHCAGSVGGQPMALTCYLFVPTQTINSSAAIPSSTYQSTRPICIHQISGLTALSSPLKDDGYPSSVACIVPPRSLCSLANARLLSAHLLAAIHPSPGDRARCTDPPESISLVSPHRHRPSPLPRRDELLHSYSTVKNNPPRCLRRKSLEPDRLSPRS